MAGCMASLGVTSCMVYMQAQAGPVENCRAYLNVSTATASTGSGSSESKPMTRSHSSKVSDGARCAANAENSHGNTRSKGVAVRLPRC